MDDGADPGGPQAPLKSSGGGGALTIAVENKWSPRGVAGGEPCDPPPPPPVSVWSLRRFDGPRFSTTMNNEEEEKMPTCIYFLKGVEDEVKVLFASFHWPVGGGGAKQVKAGSRWADVAVHKGDRRPLQVFTGHLHFRH